MTILNWIIAPAPGSADAVSRAQLATIVTVLIAVAIGAVFGEAGVVLTLGPAALYVIFKMATS